MPELLRPDICVIGAGAGGLSVAAAAAAFGVSVVLVEKGKMGGDCLNTGCVPSKSLIAAAKHARASGARVCAEIRQGRLCVSVHGDGAGGADARRGSGIVGLSDRVAALGGTLVVTSPPGRGNRFPTGTDRRDTPDCDLNPECASSEIC